jgi:AAA+ ATPase superfamily predicted ATPase
MKFLDREEEMRRLLSLSAREDGGLAVLWGRRRVGKTRLMLEWVRRAKGIYTLADQSAGPVQRRYFADSLSSVLDGFAESEYPDWRTLLRAVARQAGHAGWRGPLVIDELPYLVAASPELPSVLQGFIDHEARTARLCVALAGSSQHMMQGFQLDRSSPLFGRASEAFELRPLPAGYIGKALGMDRPTRCVEAWAAWGGIPRYWELAEPFRMDTDAAIDALVLDPNGPLHAEPDRLLVEELPPATALRPILDVVGGGAHRLSEIAGRIGVPATSLTRQLSRLQELGLLVREEPFGAADRGGKRSLYQIGDPFIRMWFRVVAPQRATLAVGGRAVRAAIWQRHRVRLVSEAWEDLCRASVPLLTRTMLGEDAPWGPPRRFWLGNGPEWAIVASSPDERTLLLGEVKWSEKPVSEPEVDRIGRALLAKGLPDGTWARGKRIVHAVFVPELQGPPRRATGRRPYRVVTAADVLACLR